jgi:hypothetical protein
MTAIIFTYVPNLSGVSDVLWYALIAAVTTTVSPMILSHFNNKNTREDRAADWARQDAIAKRASDAANTLIEGGRKATAVAAETNQKLDVIHVLVNSNMTAAMQSELVAVTAQLALIREVMEMNTTAGRKPSVDTLAVEKAAVVKVAELTASLNDRLKIQKQPAVAAEQAEAKAKGQE